MQARVRPDARLGAIVGAVAFVVYALTAYRTVPGGDSGELIGAVASGGVIHPPGYPLYSLLGGLFLHLPWGHAASLAFRMNLLSAACDALAAAFVVRAVARATGSLAGGACAGCFAFLPGVWRYAIAAEVFALNNLLVALLVWLAVLFDETRDRRYATGGAFVLGLGLSNHQTILFSVLPIVAWAVASSRAELLRPKAFVGLLLAGAAGLLPYLYLPVLASHHAFVSWGAADSWDGFWTHVLRREYGTFQLAPAGVGADVHAEDVLLAWAHHTRAQMPWWGLALAGVGVVVAAREGWRRPRGLGLVALVPPVLSVVVMMALGNLPIGAELFEEILARFWQQPDLYLAVFVGVGVAGLLKRAERVHARALVLGLGLGIAGGLLLFLLSRGYPKLDRHADSVVEQYGAEMLRTAPSGAILVTKGDLITSSIRYVMLAHHARPDVRVVDQELLATAWGRALFEANAPGVVFPGPRLSLDPRAGFSLKQLFDANRGSRVVVCGGLAPGDRSADASYGLWPLGFCDEVRSGKEPVNLDDWIAESAAAVPKIDFTARATLPGSWETIVWSDYWEVRQARAAHILTVAGANPGRQKYLPLAVDILQRVVDENPGVPPHVYKNLALAIGRVGITTPEQKAQALRAWEGYLRSDPSSDPQLPAIRSEVARLKN